VKTPPRAGGTTTALAFAVVAASLATVESAHAYTTLFAFGDSLSDAGNTFIEDKGTSPLYPYFDGHASNGPTWVEDLSVKLGLGTLTPSLASGHDFAFGGAETGPTDINPAKPHATDLPDQVAAYERAHPTPVPSALYTLDIGANDIRSALEDYASGKITLGEAKTVVAQAEDNTIDAVDDLYGLGARSLLFFGAQNLGNTPRFDGTPLQGLATELSVSFHTGVIDALAPLERSGLKVFDLKPEAAFAKIKADPEAYGFTNVTDPCWTGNMTDPKSGTLCSPTLAGQDEYLYWDMAHPTAAGHRVIADIAYDTLTATPEPSTWAMIAIGFAGLGFMGYRASAKREARAPGIAELGVAASCASRPEPALGTAYSAIRAQIKMIGGGHPLIRRSFRTREPESASSVWLLNPRSQPQNGRWGRHSAARFVECILLRRPRVSVDGERPQSQVR
jgi:phospholipase/lecithinase/hemolysin